MWLLLACAAPAPDILLVTLDTTRADALGAYGALPTPSPVFDDLAARGRLFEEAETVAPLTLPAHASMLTGLLPGRHGLRQNGAGALPDGIPTVAERLRDAGYRTGAFVSAAVLDRTFGLDQGFDGYEAGFEAEQAGPLVPSVEASVATNAFARWLLGVPRDAPWFAWIHLYDAHLPNAAHDNGFDDPYLSEIAWADSHVGEALAAARAMGRDRPLAVVIAGDHGEAHGEHGEATHGWFVYRSTVRVPLVVVAPGVAPGRWLDPVSTVDVAPTLLGIAGLASDGLDGADLRGDPPSLVYGETFTPRDGYGFSELRYAADARHRYILAPRPELFAWRDDPSEARPLDPADPAAASLKARIDAEIARDTAATAPVPPTTDAALAARLASLGYAPPGSAVTTTGPLPDPKDGPQVVAAVEEAILRARTAPPAEGVPVLEAALAAHPASGALRVTLSRGYELLGRYDEACAVLDGVSQVAHDARCAWLSLLAGDLDRADEQARRAEAWPDAIVVRAEVARRRGDDAEALRIATEGLDRAPRAASLALEAGRILAAAHRYADAVPYLERALSLDPSAADVRVPLATALAESGDLERARTVLAEQRARFAATPAADVVLAKIEAARGDLPAAAALLDPLADDPALDWQAAVVAADAARRRGDPTAARAWDDRARRLGAPAEATPGKGIEDR